ncbi:hypothetical protein [Pelagicoccus albus]|uniref:Pyrrolidone-carboxylate peptidase n=1 Tax=Pelagicoccus albus TaxID=415222 RepID=A0A7X1E8N3_9BACT|nr:hypothetical protein [Pelagicoccus albus]MBC2606529.1 hypothetical protein [Pelagicoccus albus]
MNLLIAGIVKEGNAESKDTVASALQLFAELELTGNRVETVELPESWDGCFAPLEQRLAKQWDAVVCLAEKDCDSLAIERVAINEADVTLKDKQGRRPRGKEVLPSGATGHWTSLPYRELAIKFSDAKLPAMASHSAGTGLANYVFYCLMDRLEREKRRIPAGLIQLPSGHANFDKEKGEAFLSVLLQTLDTTKIREDSLMIDMSRMRSEVR